MSKRIHGEGASSTKEDSRPPKTIKATSICEYCSKVYTSRGMSLHQKKCSKKLNDEKNEAKKTRSYKFCFLNESVHEEILSYLSNQTLTKLQMITGDVYNGCEPGLTRICCKCENDNFTNESGLCHQCFLRCRYHYHRPAVTKRVAKAFYGVKERHFVDLSAEYYGGRYLYERSDLVEFIQETCRSKKEWLRHLVKVRARWEKAEAEKWRRKKLYNWLCYRAPALARLVKTRHYSDLKMDDKANWYPRFENVEGACEGKCLELLDVLVTSQCKDHIKNGIGSVENVVNGDEMDSAWL